MIAKLRRLVSPLFTRLNGLMNRHWKFNGYTVFPDDPYYLDTFVRYPELPHQRRFDGRWERYL